MGKVRKKKRTTVKKIKVWKLKDEKKIEYKQKVRERREAWQQGEILENGNSREAEWKEMKNILPEVSTQVCGVTGGTAYRERDFMVVEW